MRTPGTSGTPDTLGGADPFRLLGVSRECSPEALHRAYRELARRTHPDRNEDPRANAQMRLINTAYLAAQQELRLRARRPVRSAVRSGVAPATAPTTAPAAPSAAHAAPASAAPTKDAGRAEREPIEREPIEREPPAPPPHPESAQPPPPARARSVPTAAGGATASHGPEQPRRATTTAPAVTALVVQGHSRDSAYPIGKARAASQPRTIAVPVPTPKRAGSAGAWADLSLGRRLLLGALAVLLIVVVVGVGWLLTQPVAGGPSGSAHQFPTSGGEGATVPYALADSGQTIMSWPGIGQVTLENRVVGLLPTGLHPTGDIQWSFDHAFVAVTATMGAAGSQPQVYVLRVQDDHLDVLPGSDPRWSPVADTLAFASHPVSSRSQQVSLVGFTASGMSAPGSMGNGEAPIWSQDGTSLAFSASGQRAIDVLRVAANAPVAWYRAPSGERVTPLLWMNAQALLCSEADASSTKIVVVQPNGKVSQIANVASSHVAGAWSLEAGNGGTLIATRLPKQDTITLSKLTLNPATQTWTYRPLGTLPGMRYVAGVSGAGQWLVAASQHDRSGQSHLCLVPPGVPQQSTDLASSMKCLVVHADILGLGRDSTASDVSYVADTGKDTPIKLQTVSISVSTR